MWGSLNLLFCVQKGRYLSGLHRLLGNYQSGHTMEKTVRSTLGNPWGKGRGGGVVYSLLLYMLRKFSRLFMGDSSPHASYPKAASKFIFLVCFNHPWWILMFWKCFRCASLLPSFRWNIILKYCFFLIRIWRVQSAFKTLSSNFSWNNVEGKKLHWVFHSKVNIRSIVFFTPICKPRTKHLITSLAREIEQRQAGSPIMKISVILCTRVWFNSTPGITRTLN